MSVDPAGFGRFGAPEFVILLVGLTIFVASFIFYFVPTIVAIVRRKANILPIALVNIFLGWTLVGWVVALVWAVSTQVVDAPPAAVTVATAPISQLCPHCGKYSPAAAKFCGQCGQAIAGPASM